MQATKKNLSELLSQDVRLIAPLFQRPYVWDQDENWEPLWYSISEQVQARLDGEQPRPYFLGALVTSQLPTPFGDVTSREIIDGQQRMTTFQILFRVARTEFERRGFDFQASQMLKLSKNEVEHESDSQFKVWPTNSDRDQFRRVMLGDNQKSHMQKAAEYFKEELMEYLGDEESEAKRRAEAFVQSIKQDLVFVAIDLDGEDDGQLIFETLNSLGTPLLPSDLVKNLLFREAADQRLDTEGLFEKYWRPFEDDKGYWRGETKVGRRKRERIDVYLQHYATYRLRSELSVTHQFREYRDAFKKGVLGNAEDALQEFARFADLYREFDEAKEGDAGSLRHVLWVLDLSVLNPLILGIYERAQNEVERDSMLRILESYTIRRFLIGSSTKNYNKLALDTAKSLDATSWTAESLRSVLRAHESKTSVWPTDEDIVSRLVQSRLYGNIRRGGLQYVLGRVESLLRTSKQEDEFDARRSLTIEHVMPQKWKRNWPLDDPSDRDARWRRDEAIDRVGNLTILTQALNSAASNSCWDQKRKIIDKESVLRINKLLVQCDCWNERAIEERSNWIAGQVCRIWPR
jgi:uncharacterized protein with ParB-like and HNH nuclease domain